MKNAILKLAGVAALTTLAGGLVLLAQNSGLSPRSSDQPHQWRHSQGQGQSGQDWAARRLDRLSSALNLTADQQQTARTMLSDTREQARPLMRQIHENRKALFAAIKAGNTSDIDRLTSAQAPLMAQMTAIQAKGFAKFYATLNTDQKAKVDTMAGHAGALFMGGMAKHHS